MQMKMHGVHTTISRKWLRARLDRNRLESAGVRIGDVEVLAYRGYDTYTVFSWVGGMWLEWLEFDDVYNIVTGCTDLALARALCKLIDDHLIALRFATS